MFAKLRKIKSFANILAKLCIYVVLWQYGCEAENPHTIKYFQVTQTLNDEQVKMRELRSLENISDNYEKIILTMDKIVKKAK